MGSQIHMETPMCLIENQRGKLAVCRDALQRLSQVDQPVVVVAVAGLYRTGKSYLMNKLAGKNAGFPLGSKVQANTKGIWMWCVPYPGSSDQTLVLLDTEGLGDVEKGDTKNDTWIFALAVLLSSTFIYNSIGTINQQAMDQLHYVTELTERIKAKSLSGENPQRPEDSAEFLRFFPSFIWVLRDFTLHLFLNNKPITEDEYLENALKLKKGDSIDIQTFNLPRECIRLFFPNRKCFVFDRPTTGKKLHLLEEMQESDLEPDFVEQAGTFCHYIYGTAKKKTIPGGHVVTGRWLAYLVVTYVDTISRGEVPCIENAVLALAEIENSAAVHEAAECYEKLMREKLKLPTESLQDLLKIHALCEKEAIRVFMDRSFKDETRRFQVELMKIVSDKKEEYCKMNQLESRKRCSELLTRLFRELEDGIQDGKYNQPGSYQNFRADQQAVMEQYRKTPGKGVMAEEVLDKFLQDKDTVGKAILQNDKALTEKQREMEEAKARAAAAEREQKLQKQQLALSRKQMEDQERSFQVNIQELKTKMEHDRKNLLEEQNKLMESILTEQAKLLNEGFQKHTKQLNAHIQQLKEENENIQKPSWFSRITDTVLASASFIMRDCRYEERLNKILQRSSLPYHSQELKHTEQPGEASALKKELMDENLHSQPSSHGAGIRSAQITEKPTDPWEGVICDQCPREETFPEKTVPEIDIGHQRSHQTYRLVTTGAGILHCSYTDLIFEVTKAVTITYHVDSWYEHLEEDETRELIIAGPLFNIQADPVEALAAARFPHFLCLAGEDSSKVQIAHFSEGVMSLDNPDIVGPFHAVLKNPTFSPRGVVAKLFNNKKTKVHAMALLYHLEALGTSACTFHLYLLPNNPCLKKAVDDQEQSYRSRSVPKPPGTLRPLRINATFLVQKSDDITVTPRKYTLEYLDPDMQQQYFEVYAEGMKEKLQLCLVEKQDKEEEPVWEAWVRQKELMQPELPPPPAADNTKSPNTNRDHLLHILEDLKEEDLKKFKDKLYDFPKKESYGNIPRGQLQKADPLDLKNLLFEYYTDYTMELTIEVLKAANLKQHADSLASSLGERTDWSR